MLEIPFYSNTKDNLHCMQACLKSVLKFYFPKKNFSFKYLDKVTAHKKGMYTWSFAALLFLKKIGFDVVYIVDHDLKRLYKDGEKYFRSIWPDEIFYDQKKYSDFDQERRLVGKLLKNKNISLFERSARVTDLRKFFAREYFLMVSFNSMTLDDQNGYSPHIVSITNITKNFVYFHDPGLPPRPDRKASIKKFWQAASYPDNSSVDLIAVRMKR